MNGMAGAAGALTGAVRAVRDVLFSRGCAGCGALDEVLCGTCMRGLVQPVCFDLPATVCGIGMACGSYHGPLRRAVLAWKDHGDAECDGPFSDAMVALLQAEPLRSTLDQVGAVAVVPAPSSWRSICTRGRSQLDPIAGALAERLCAWGVEARVQRALEVRHIRAKSVQTASARGGVNVSPAISVAAMVCVCLQACRSSSSMTSSRREPRCANASMSYAHKAIRCSLRWPSPMRRRGHRNDHESLSPCSAICG